MKKVYNILALVLMVCLNADAKDGMYVEFKMTTSSINGVMKTYTSGGNTRTESDMQMSGGRSMSMVVLMLASNPGIVYLLNEAGKTYTETDAAKQQSHEDDDYDVSVMGKEKVNSYNCTHVKVTNKTTQKVMELWLSKDIVNYARYASVKNKYFGGGKLFNQLKAVGADGYVARMVANDERGGQIQLDLVKAESKDIDASMFSLNGYTKSATMNPAGGPGAPGAVDAKQLQNMTPEERQQYIQQMKEKYHH